MVRAPWLMPFMGGIEFVHSFLTFNTEKGGGREGPRRDFAGSKIETLRGASSSDWQSCIGKPGLDGLNRFTQRAFRSSLNKQAFRRCGRLAFRYFIKVSGYLWVFARIYL
jgi:hypothetical protein